MTVRQQTNLVKRGSVYYFRKKVPQDLRDHYGRESIRKSLREFTTQAEAKREAGRLADLYEAEFETIRRSRTAPPVPLTPELIPQLARAMEAHILGADDEARTEGLDELQFVAMAEETSSELQSVRSSYARGDTSPITHALSDWLTGLGIESDPSSPTAALLRRRFLEARLRALQGKARRNEGDIVDTPAAPTFPELRSSVAALAPTAPEPARKGSGHRLSDVVDYWKTTGQKTHGSTAHADTLVKEFTALHGDVPLRDIGKGHFVALRDKMLQRVMPATVQARFNLLKAAFTVCRQDDQLGITQNPIEDVKIRNVDTGEKSRDAFTAEQLQTLFDSEVFTKGERPEGGRGDAAFWAPLVALFTGARLDEILALRTDGIYELEGVPVMHFRHRPELGQRLKGKAKNNRRVPIHPELLRLGILQYLEGVKARGPWLFPDIDRSEKKRSHSSAWGAWFGRYLNRMGVKTDKLTFHSLRHTFKHFSRASGIPEDHHDAMTGHTTAEVARRYGSAEGYPVQPLAESMGRLTFGKLRLLTVKR